MLVVQLCPSLCDPVDCIACQAPLSMEFSSKNTGVGCHALLQGIFPTQGLNLGFLHVRQMLYHLRHQPINSYIITVEVIHSGPYYCYLKFLILSCYLCIWLCWVFIAAQAFSPVVKSEGYSLVAVHRLSIVMTSLVAEHGL